MRVFEVMTRNVQTVPATMPAADAWELMRSKRIHHLVVTDGPEVVGLLSARDAGGSSGQRVRMNHTVADFMTKDVVSVGPNKPLRQTASLMRGRTIGCVPVTERGKLVGILTVSDLLEMLGRGVERPRQKSRPIATHRVPHRKVKGRRVAGTW